MLLDRYGKIGLLNVIYRMVMFLPNCNGVSAIS